MAHKQISRGERELIEHYLKQGAKPYHIALKLSRSPSSINAEIKHNGTSLGYKAEFATYHSATRKKTANGRRRKIQKDSALERYIFTQLRARWSPEDIAQSLKRQKKLSYVSAKSIYYFITTRHPEFRQYLLLKNHLRRKYKNGKKELIPNRIWIDERPKEVIQREEFGHWENDTIVSGCRKKAIVTSAERVSGFFLARKMETREAEALNEALIREFTSLPEISKKTCTNDNGPEFASHEAFALSLNMRVYFAHPYHSWERPVNENTNRQLRRFFPKGTYFTEIEEWEIDWAVNLINNKPRKRLNYHTPAEVFNCFIH